LQNAVVAIEDHRFYEHRGLDFESIGRAALEDLRSMSIQEGGSTITQQLIKNTYIAQKERMIPSFQRKFVEASLAWQYEKEHSKQEILEQYLNTVYFGANAYGAEAAARTYFNKSADDLTLPESALLAGIINLPGVYDPFADPEAAKDRRNVVLDRMLEYGYITEEEHDKAVKSDLSLSRGRVEHENGNAYFLDAVRRELAQEYGDNMVYEGGLKIYTTLDPHLQELANSAVNSIVNPEAGDPSAALVSIDPATGAVRAMVGGSDFNQVKFNLATQAHRQAGSSFKPFVYAEAIHQGISPESTYVSKHLEINMGPYSHPYVVDNYDYIHRGPITIEKALAESDNTVFVQLALDLGLMNVVEMAHKMGITSKIGAYPSTAIGGLGEGVTPFEMASAYSTLPNEGIHMKPYLVQKVTKEENGQEIVLEQHHPKQEQALSRDQAAVVTQALRGVITNGTASYYHDLDAEIGRPSAGKTGTTNNFMDAWFIGFIPQLCTSVWVGYPDERRPMVNINGLKQVNGENYPLDIWSVYMQDAVKMFPVQQFEVPSPYLHLQIKTDGRAVPPEATESTNETTQSSGTSEDNANPQPTERQLVQPVQSATPAPQSATPAPQSAPPQAPPAALPSGGGAPAAPPSGDLRGEPPARDGPQ
jgi:penicillin-binding protein 1A